MPFRIGLAALCLLLTTPALAIDVFLNGVKVTGALQGQTFENAKVTIDAAGNVRIDAPGYKVELEGAAEAIEPASQPAVAGANDAGQVAVRHVAPAAASVVLAVEHGGCNGYATLYPVL